MKTEAPGKKPAVGSTTISPIAEKSAAPLEVKPLGFSAAEGIPTPTANSKKLSIGSRVGGGVNGLVAAMKNLVAPNARLATIGVVWSSANTENPAADLFHQFRGGQNFIFSQGPQNERVFAAACKAASGFMELEEVRVIRWTSANGWLEYDPKTAEPKFDEKGQIKYNQKALIDDLYGAQPQGVVLDHLNPVEALKAIASFETTKKEDFRGRAVFVMEGIGPHLEQSLNNDGRLFQQLQDMRPSLNTDNGTTHVIFSDGPSLMPSKASDVGSRFNMPLPTRRTLEVIGFGSIVNFLYGRRPDDAVEKEANAVTEKEIAAWRPTAGDNIGDNLIRNAIADGITGEQFKAFFPEGKTTASVAEQLVGFTNHAAKDMLGEAISRSEPTLDFDFLTTRRFQMLKENFHIELFKRDDELPKVSGLDRVLEDLGELKAAFAPQNNRKKSVKVDKMVLLAGVPGMGKSLLVKNAAEILDKPLIKLDLARLFNKFVGESESNFARMFEILESLAPCVVWIDEIEKALGGTAEGAVATDGGVTDRVHGLFLTWLEEHKSKVLVMGTCNDPTKLSAALLSRMNSKYFVGYQEPKDLAGVWKSNLDASTDAHNLTAAQLLELAELKRSLTGREISQVVQKARLRSLNREEAELITMGDLKPLVADLVTEYEKNPYRAQQILQMSDLYISASGKPVFDPGVGGAVVIKERPDEAAPGGGRGVRRGRGNDDLNSV
ncbi:MAG: ATP-binding protein [Deltaproteobacteria bacterium]|nr:ATP-binding protein [Deltaproteobacteria bacterium]